MKAEIEVCDAVQVTTPWTALEGHERVNLAGLASTPNWHEPKRAMAPRHIAIRVRKRYAAPSRCIFNAWLDPEVAGKWLFATASQPMAHVEIDRRVGGSFCFVERRDDETARYMGQYMEIVPDSRLAFTLSMQPHPDVVTRVTVAIAPLAKGCTLKLTHDNIPRAHASYVEGRWTGILYGLSVTIDPKSATFGPEDFGRESCASQA